MQVRSIGIHFPNRVDVLADRIKCRAQAHAVRGIPDIGWDFGKRFYLVGTAAVGIGHVEVKSLREDKLFAIRGPCGIAAYDVI